ncbi:MAG TPA: helix-turn-helix domain-containing protein [Candidatus Thermoplasmatota archaeon]|nr:helix-turn-helix domain-containing protein [Candidatus Thermoplasmatota archaeon]
MDDPLELETRRRIYQFLQKRPGAHMREIGRELDIPMGTLEYHLHYLVKANLLNTRQDPRYTRYFATGELSRRDKDILAVLRQKVPRQVAAHLLLAPGSTHGALLEKFALAPSTLSFHLKKLVAAGIVEQRKSGRENLYTVVEPDLVARVLVQHRESFFDDVIDRFAEVWQGLEPRADEPPQGPGEGGGLLMVLQAVVRVAFA